MNSRSEMQCTLSFSSQVRRNLFGPMDRKSNDDFLIQQLQTLSEHSCSVWNFDFFRGIPRSGRYLWERVIPTNESVSRVPSSNQNEIIPEIKQQSERNYNKITTVKSVNSDRIMTVKKMNTDRFPTMNNARISTVQEEKNVKVYSIRSLLTRKKLKKEKFEKENTVRGSFSRRKLSRKAKKPPQKVLLQTSIKGYLKVCKPRSSKRLRSSRRKPRPTTKPTSMVVTKKPTIKKQTRMTTRCCSIRYGTNKTKGR